MFSILLLALACTTDDDDGTVDDTTTTDDTAVDDTGEASNECEPDDSVVTVEGLYGTVSDNTGAAIQCMRVQFCTEVCINADSNGSGEYAVVPQGSGTGAFTVQPLTDTYADYFTAGVPLNYDGERQVIVKLQPITERFDMPATAEALQLSEEINLTIGVDNYEKNFSADNTFASATMVSEADWFPVEGVQGLVLAMHFLAPYHGHSDGMPIEVFYPNATADMALYEFVYDDSNLVYEWRRIETTVEDNLLKGELHYLTTLLVVNEVVSD
ncbi:MAG: hypothetical protein ACI9VR_003949 [Cognaticolwellia sp.]|jgi:hypothetical protein